jgi:MFS family permease
VPTFVQGSLGTGPLVAGFALATLTIGWPITASQSAKVYMRIGFRPTALIGSAAAIVGTGLMIVLDTSSSVFTVAAFCFLIGAGMGFVASPTLIAAQATVGWSERGVVTGNNLFSRSMGMAVGVAVFGAIANSTLPSNTDTHSPAALATASNHVFTAVAVMAVLMSVAVLFMPSVRATD